jgi:hypothetical protein
MRKGAAVVVVRVEAVAPRRAVAAVLAVLRAVVAAVAAAAASVPEWAGAAARSALRRRAPRSV